MTPKVSIIVPVWNQEKLVLTALDSIPRRDDIEVLVYDDGSTDSTFINVRDFRTAHPELNIVLLYGKENRGVATAKNVLYEAATGEYIHELDSDDYLYTAEYERALGELDGTDIVYIDLIANGGMGFALTEESKHGYCAGTARFYKRSLIGKTRCPEDKKAGEDWFFNEEILKKPHTEKFTGIKAYHYNFPREGSLYDRMIKGML